MKRSEMIDLMLKTERDCQEYKCGKAFMETLLKNMEEEGMMPPIQEGLPPDDYDYITWAMEEFYNWEQEDE